MYLSFCILQHLGQLTCLHIQCDCSSSCNISYQSIFFWSRWEWPCYFFVWLYSRQIHIRDGKLFWTGHLSSDGFLPEIYLPSFQSKLTVTKIGQKTGLRCENPNKFQLWIFKTVYHPWIHIRRYSVKWHFLFVKWNSVCN